MKKKLITVSVVALIVCTYNIYFAHMDEISNLMRAGEIIGSEEMIKDYSEEELYVLIPQWWEDNRYKNMDYVCDRILSDAKDDELFEAGMKRKIEYFSKLTEPTEGEVLTLEMLEILCG